MYAAFRHQQVQAHLQQLRDEAEVERLARAAGKGDRASRRVAPIRRTIHTLRRLVASMA